MNTQITALTGEYLDPRDMRFCRTQHEAGIAHLRWEKRLKPLRPLSHDLAAVLVTAATIMSAVLVH
jgi:hypothetical protein